MIKLLINILKSNLDQYSNMVKTDIRPLEYIEIKKDKPLIIKLNKKYMFKCGINSISEFIAFNDSKNIIFKKLDELNSMENNKYTQITKIIYYRMLIDLLYEISKSNYKGRIRKYYYKKFMVKYLLDNYEAMLEILKNVLNFNSMLKKKQQYIQSIDIYNNVYSDLSIGGLSLRELIRVDPKTGEKYFVR